VGEIPLVAATLSTRTSKAPNPYVGPPPFRREDGDRFFGRDREISELYSLVAAHRTVLLYAQSGAGKTSLLNAKLIPALEQGGFDVRPTVRFSQLGAGKSRQRNRPMTQQVEKTTGTANPGHNRLVGVFQRALEGPPRNIGNSPDSLPRVLIFDQFEEFFTSYPELWEQRRGFFEELDNVMSAEPSLRVLFAMREDFVANIDPYQDLLPEECRTRYRLERLRPDAALAAVERPLENTGIQFAPGVAKQLVENLLKAPSPDRNAPTESAESTARRDYGTEEFVEPVQLQVVCFSLYRNLSDETKAITDQDLAAFGDVDQALREFYNNSLIETVSKTNVDEDTLRRWFEEKLITEARTRDLAFRGETLTEGLPNPAVDVLDKIHIIRDEVRGQSRWYELSHDRFIGPVLRANDAWRARVQAAEEEKRKAEDRRLRREAKRLQTLAYALGASLVIAIAAASFAGYQYRNASMAKEFAEGKKREADLKAEEANASAAAAAKAKQAAEEAFAGQREATRSATDNAVAAAKAKQTAEEALADRQKALDSANASEKNAQIEAAAADQSRNIAQAAEAESRKQSLISASQALAATSLNKRATDPQLAVWLALYSVSTTGKIPDDSRSSKTVLVTHQSLDALLAAAPMSILVWNEVADCATSAEAKPADRVATSLAAVAFTSDGKSIAALDQNGSPHTWDLKNGARVIAGPCVQTHPVAEALSRQGNFFAVTQLREEEEEKKNPRGPCVQTPPVAGALNRQDNSVAVTRLGEEKEEKNEKEKKNPVTVTMGRRSQVAVTPIPASSACPTILPTHYYQPEALAFSPDGKYLAVTSASWSRRAVYDLSTQHQLWTSLIPRVRRLASRLIDDTLGRSQLMPESMAFTPDNKFLAVGLQNGTVEFRDTRDGSPTGLFLSKHRDAVLAMDFWYDNKSNVELLATASRDHTVGVWEIKSAKEASLRTTLKGHTDAVISVAFDPEGKYIATGSQDQTIGIWDIKSGQEVLSLRAEGGYVTGVGFSADGTSLASSSSNGTVRLWHIADLDKVTDFSNKIQALKARTAFKEDIGSEPLADVLELLDLGERRTRRKLTEEECDQYLGRPCPVSPKSDISSSQGK
jgi:WD40 repeat protein